MNIEPIMDDEQKEQARQLNLIGELDRLHRVNWELQQKGLMFDIEITRLRAENETLRRDVKTAVMGDSAELADVKRENEKLRAALKPFAAYVEQPTQIYEHDGVRMTLVNQDVLMRLCQAASAAIRESGE